MPKPWRTGRKVGRTIYEMDSDTPSDDDRLIGMLDTSALSEGVVLDHNLVRGFGPTDEIRAERELVDRLYRDWQASAIGGESLDFGRWLIERYGPVGERAASDTAPTCSPTEPGNPSFVADRAGRRVQP